MKNELIEFTAQKYKSLKREFDKAVENNKDQFQFEGKTWVTNYAKYALQYLQPKFDHKK